VQILNLRAAIGDRHGARSKATHAEGSSGCGSGNLLNREGELCALLITIEERVDQAGSQVSGAEAVTLGERGGCPGALLGEPNGNRLEVFGYPGAVNAGEGQGIVNPGDSGADLMFVVREQDCIENGSLGVGDGHNCILHLGTKAEPVLYVPGRSQYHTKVNLLKLGVHPRA
jgi:hypothetical protein